MSNTSNIINFQPQPDFPVEDINEQNAAMADYYLTHSEESKAYVNIYQQTLQRMYRVGNAALQYSGTNPGNNSGEARAFCHGFATIDYVATLLDSRPFKQIANGAGMGYFYLQHTGFEDVELAKRIAPWRQSHEKTLELLLSASDRHNESPKQFSARLVGAQVASELFVIR